MTEKDKAIEKVTVDIKQLTEMLSVGRNTALAIAESAGAGIKFGRRKLYSVAKIKAFMNAQAEEQNNER